MWIPGGVFHGVAALVMFYKWFREDAHAATLH
jgi:hypothetical protein